jgi:hypothetical protein
MTLYFSQQGSKSSDRISRVVHKLRAGTHATDAADADSGRAAGLQARIDPLIVIVKVPSGVSAVLATAISSTGSSGEKGLGSVATAELKSAKCNAHCRVLQGMFSPRGDGLEAGSFIFGKGSVGEEFTAAGSSISPFNPVTRNNNGQVEWVVGASEMLDATEVLWAAASHAMAKPKLATLLQPRSTYSDLDGNPVCIASGTEAATPGVAAMANKATAIKCEICGMMWDADKTRHHMGAHIATGSWGQIPVSSQPRFPCGICGIREAVQYTPIPASVTGCPVSLTKHNSTFKASHQCKHVAVPLYSLVSASKANRSGPCTIVPIMCRLCPKKPMPVVIYKYSME